MPTIMGDAINCGREIKSANPDICPCKGECVEGVITIVWKEKDKLKISYCQVGSLRRTALGNVIELRIIN